MRNADTSKSLQWLRILAVLSILAPLLIYGLLGVFRYIESTQEAAQRVSRSLRVAHEHASKVLGGAAALQDRLLDMVEGKSLAELRATEAALYRALSARVKDQAQIQSVWIIGADGKPVASSAFFPTPRLDFSDRPYFEFHRQAQRGRFLSEPFTSRTTGDRVLDLSVRFNGPDGAFGGVVNVSLLATYFQQFYGDIVAEEPGLAVSMFMDSGPIVARYPAAPGLPTRMGPTSPILASIRAGSTAGQLRGVSSVDHQDRLLAYNRVGEYPLYVGTGMSLTAVRQQFLKELGLLAALGLVPFGALFFAARVVGRRTREAVESAERLRRETDTRRRAEEALLQAQKLEALGRLTGGVAHDFNNALMVISNNAYLLRRNVEPPGEPRLQSIDRAVASATKLTRQLLAFSRRQALLPEVVRLQDRLPALRELLAPVLGSRIALVVEVAGDVRPIVVDMAELELALLNLGINARDAMPAGGTLTLRARAADADKPARIAGDAVVVEVIDTGAGIAPELLDKVFEPFFTTKPVGQGTGLGLSQVYGLCERAGGMAAISSAVGQGTTVGMYFPAAPADAAALPEAPPSVEHRLDKSVLVVEDNEEVAAALLPLLAALGCTATRVDGAAAAREWLAARPAAPDLVLTDVMMAGDMDGIALARWIRANHPRQPVLLMTGYAERIDEATAAGFEVLPKPCTPAMLGAAIGRVAG